MSTSRKFLRRKEGEIAKAAGMFADALFGNTDEFTKKVREQLAREEQRGDRESGVITTEGYSFVRCVSCGLDQAISPEVAQGVVRAIGWRTFVNGWRCALCADSAE